MTVFALGKRLVNIVFSYFHETKSRFVLFDEKKTMIGILLVCVISASAYFFNIVMETPRIPSRPIIFLSDNFPIVF